MRGQGLACKSPMKNKAGYTTDRTPLGIIYRKRNNENERPQKNHAPVALFDDMVPADVLHELCVVLFENIEGASTVVVIDTDNGEVVAEVAEPYDPDDGDWDREMGFDPYEGCYSYDC